MTTDKYVLEQDTLNHLRGVMLLGACNNRPTPVGALGIVAMIAGIHPLCEKMEAMETVLHTGTKPSRDYIELQVWWKEVDKQ